ncbi:Uncharacterised protein [Klebsiella aerogenes]|nr:Uncharacterised protein [Klebsiella aerogenes]
MLSLGLHPFCRNGPELGIEIDLGPFAPEASEGRTSVSSCHSMRQRVGTDKLDITSDRINFGNSSGRSVGMFCFFWFLKGHANT